MMTRRDAIQRVAIMMGGALTVPSLAIALENYQRSGNSVLTAEQMRLVAEVAETIIPRTKTPGAKDAKVPQFISDVVSDCYNADEQKIFTDGLKSIQQNSRKRFGKNFELLSAAQRTEILKGLEAQWHFSRKEIDENNVNLWFDISDMNPRFWRMIKELTLLGYFTSEPGCTQALRYQHVPGKFEGCIPYKKGDKAWAT
ncbi:MAG: gluconate 2-dehydrogenase subunit 3 family protein [Cytophagales bacterium]|nr:gluconate 2-dehydrogenase subunit 3 family protein [Bernardetiaceae bacterium]MDW8206012.1 gluconate 2-dehydrogenase subunit 3 family protein [Cytophagales bacterium]